MPPRRRNWQSPPAFDPRRITALSQALDLARAPRLAAHMRRQPLPREVDLLIRLAAGCRESLAAAAAATAREPDFLLAAAELYLRQVVCFPGADPHRVLGVAAGAPRAEMRRHLKEFILWLHPDRNARGGDRALMHRVLEAWRAVNEPAARNPPAGTTPRRRRASAYRPSWISRPLPYARTHRSLVRRLRIVLRLALVTASMVIPGLGALALFGLAGAAAGYGVLIG